MEAAEQIQELTRILEEANYRYYVLDHPNMEDFEYDRLMRQLEELEEQHPDLASPLSPTKRVGGQALDQFERWNTRFLWRAYRTCFPWRSWKSLTPKSGNLRRTPCSQWNRRWTAYLWRWNT